MRLVFGPTVHTSLPAAACVALATLVACASVRSTGEDRTRITDTTVRLDALADRVATWHAPAATDGLRGLRLLYDTPLDSGPTLAIVRAVTRANHRLDPFDALVFVDEARAVAARHRLDPDFFCAAILQESAFDPRARSAVGAIGIAQFTLETADAVGVDPFDWIGSLRGAAALLGGYVAAYDGRYADPYAAALAAYDAGPGAVSRYGGVPPYPETRAYITDIYDRWSRVLSARRITRARGST